MPHLVITDVRGQRKTVQSTQELRFELDLYEEAIAKLVDRLGSDDDAVGEQAMSDYRGLKARYDAIAQHVPEFNQQHVMEVRAERKRLAQALRQWRAERNGNPPPQNPAPH